MLRSNNGITLMSVMVATALLGVVALATMRLFVNQNTVIRTVALKDERIRILEHYRNVVIGGWDKTRSEWGGSGAIAVYDRSGSMRVSGSGLTLGENGLYQADPNGWWTVQADAALGSGVAVPQSYQANRPETIVSVKMSVSFDPEKHPSVKTKMGKVEEIVFLHNNITNTSNTQCSGAHPSKLKADGTPFYLGEAAIIQYDFKSNYTKCSQVPLVNLSIQPTQPSQVLTGFQSRGGVVTGDPLYPIIYLAVGGPGCSDYEYIYKIDSGGRPHCSDPKLSTTVAGYCRVGDPIQIGNPPMGVAVAVGADAATSTCSHTNPLVNNATPTIGNLKCTSSCRLHTHRGPVGGAGGGPTTVYWSPVFDDSTQCPSIGAACPNPALWGC